MCSLLIIITLAKTCAQTDVAFILKVVSGAVIPRIWAQLRLRAVVSFTASFSLTKKEGNSSSQGTSVMRVFVLLPLLECNTIPSSMQHSKARCILVPGLHMLLSASPCTLLSLANCHRCVHPQPKPLIWQSGSWVTSSAEECSLLLRRVTTEGSNSTRDVDFSVLITIRHKSCLFFSSSAGNREHCSRGGFQRLPSSSHGWQLLRNVTIFGWNASGSSLETSCEKKKEVSDETNAQVAGSDLSVCRWCRFPFSLATKWRLRPFAVERQCC